MPPQRTLNVYTILYSCIVKRAICAYNRGNRDSWVLRISRDAFESFVGKCTHLKTGYHSLVIIFHTFTTLVDRDSIQKNQCVSTNMSRFDNRMSIMNFHNIIRLPPYNQYAANKLKKKCWPLGHKGVNVTNIVSLHVPKR